jgi:Domain of unknown function (DUF1918)
MDVKHSKQHARVGDWLEVRGIPGAPSRRGQILEILGDPDHEHYRVRWDEAHESIFFPSEGTMIVRPGPHLGAR